MDTTGPGYFDQPIEFNGLPEPSLQTRFQEPYEPGISVLGGTPQSSLPPLLTPPDSIEQSIRAFKQQSPTFQTRTVPAFFDWDKTQAERFVSSDYYKELGFDPYGSNESKYGYRQTLGSVMGNALAGSGKLAWNTFLDGWQGWGRMVDALFSWDGSKLMGSPEEMEKLHKEQVAIFNKYAIYRTPESEATVFNRQLLGDLIQQSGYALGALGQFLSEELLTMGMSSFLKPLTGARTIAQLGRAGITMEELYRDLNRVGNIVQETGMVQKIYQGLKNAGTHLPVIGGLVGTGADFSRRLRTGSGGWELAGVTLNGLRRTLAETNMALTESRMEAAGTYGELRETLYDQTMREKGTVSFEEQQRIESLAGQAASDNFRVNALVIAAMNRLQFDNLFSTFGSSKRIFREMAEQGDQVFTVSGKAVKDVVDNTGKVLTKKGDPLKKAYDKGTWGRLGRLRQISGDFGKGTALKEAASSIGKHALKMEATEGFQEIIQETSNVTVKDYYSQLYNNDNSKDKPDWETSIQQGFTEQLTTQGLKTFLMGALTGKLMSPINFAFRKMAERQGLTKEERKTQKLSRTEAIDTINTFLADPSRFAPLWVASTLLQNKAAKSMEEAISTGSKYQFENAKDDAFAHTVMTAKQLHMLGTLLDTVRGYGNQMEEKEFREAFGVDFTAENRKNVHQYVNQIADEIEGFSKRHDQLRDKYSDLISPQLYSEKDQPRARMMQRALADTLTIMATSEFQAGRSAKRYLEIMGAAVRIPGIEKSSSFAFRILGDEVAMESELALLEQEITVDRQGTQTTEIKQRIRRKEKEIKSLQVYKQHRDFFSGNTRSNTSAVKKMIQALGAYLGAKNEELSVITPVPEASLHELFFQLEDFRQLQQREKKFTDVFNVIATNEAGTYARLLEGLETHRNNLSRQLQQLIQNTAAASPQNNTATNNTTTTGTLATPAASGAASVTTGTVGSPLPSSPDPTKVLSTSPTDTNQTPVPETPAVSAASGTAQVFEYTSEYPYLNPAHGIEPVTFRIKVDYNDKGHIQQIGYFNKGAAAPVVQLVPPFYDKTFSAAAINTDEDLARYFKLMSQLDYFSRLAAGGLQQQITKSESPGKKTKSVKFQQVIPAIIAPEGKDSLVLPLEEDVLVELLAEQVFEPEGPEEQKENYQAMTDAIRLHLVTPLEQLKLQFVQQSLANKKATKDLFRLDVNQSVRVFTIAGKTKGDLDKLLRTVPPDVLTAGISLRVSRNPAGKGSKEIHVNSAGKVLSNPSPLNMELLYGGQVIGYLSHPHALSAVIKGAPKYLGELTPLEFGTLFDTSASFAEVKAAFNSSVALTDSLEKALGKEQSVVIDPGGLSSIAFFQVSAGEYDFTGELRPLQQVADAGNEIIAIIDKLIPDQPTVITTTLIRTQERTEETIRLLKQEQFEERTKNQGRYSAMVRLPGGQVKFIELVSAALTPDEQDTLFLRITEQLERTITNNVHYTAQKKAVAADAQYNNAFNDTMLHGQLFIALPLEHKGLYVSMELTATGDLQLTMFKKNDPTPRQQIYVNQLFTGGKVRIKNFKELLIQINSAIIQTNTVGRTNYPVLKPDYFRRSISAHPSYAELMAQGTKVSPQVVKNMRLYCFASKEVITPLGQPSANLSATPAPAKTPARRSLDEVDMKALRDTEQVMEDKDELPRRRQTTASDAASKLQQLQTREAAEIKALRNRYEDKQGVIKDISSYTQALNAITENYKKQKAALVADTGTKRTALKVVPDSGYGERDLDDLRMFLEWTKRNLPAAVTVNELDELAGRLTNGNVLLGRFNTWLRTIEINPDKNAFKYHEAFHAVFRLLLGDEQIDQLLRVARHELTVHLRKNGQTLAAASDKFRLSDPLYYALEVKELEERYLEEWLADEFHFWKQQQLQEQTSSSDNAILRFFRKLLSVIRSVFRTRQALPQLFRTIDQGKFRNSQITDNRFTRAVGEMNPLIANKIFYDDDYFTDHRGHTIAVKKYLSEADTQRVVGGIVNTFLRRTEGIEALNKLAVLEEILDDYQRLYLGKAYQELTAEKIDRLEVFKKIYSDQAVREQILQSVDGYLRLLGFDQALDSDDIEVLTDDMGDRRTTDHWNETHSFGGFKSLSSYVRKYIQSTAYDGEDEFGNAYLNEQTGERLLVGVNAGIIYNGLLKICAGVTSAEKFIGRLQIFREENPECGAFVEKFISDTGLVFHSDDGTYTAHKDPRLFNAVYKAFTLFQVDYMTLRINPGVGADIKLSNRRDAAANQYNRWQNAFIFHYQDQLAARSILKEGLLRSLRSLAIPFQLQYPLTDDELFTFVGHHLRDLQRLTGIKISKTYLTYSILLTLRNKKFPLTESQETLLNSFSEVEPITAEDIMELARTIAADENPFINFDRLYDDPQEPLSAKWMPPSDEDPVVVVAQGNTEIHQSLGKGNETRLRKIAKNNALFDETVLATSWVNAEGKTVWSHQLPAFHLVYIESFIKDPEQLLRRIQADPFLRGTYFGSQVLSGDPSGTFTAMLRHLSVRRVDGLRQIIATVGKDGRLIENRRLEFNKKEGITYGDFGDREMILALIGMYLEPETVAVNLPDKQDPALRIKKVTTTRHLIRVLEASNTGNTINLPVIRAIQSVNGKLSLSTAAKEAIEVGLDNEYNRIREVARSIDEDKTGKVPLEERIADYNDYQKPGSKLRGLKFWNFSNLLGELALKLETRAQQKFNQPLRASDKTAALAQIEKALVGEQGMVDEFITLMHEAGIISKKENGDYANELLPPYFFGTRRKQPERLNGLYLGSMLRENVAQFFVNDFINTGAFNELLLGDQAKSLKDFIDAVKRAKGANASGPNLRSDILAPQLGITERFDESYVHLHKDEEYLGTYSNTHQKRTDAQMWATTKAHRYIEFGLGRLTSKSADFIDLIELGLPMPPGAFFDPDGSIANNYQASVKKVVYYDGSQYIKTSMFVLTKRFTSYLKPAIKEEVTALLDLSDGVITEKVRELCNNNENWLPRPDRVVLHNKRVMLEDWEKKNQRVAFSIPESAAKLMRVNAGRDLQTFHDGSFTRLDNSFWRLQAENPSNKLHIIDPTQARQIIDTEQNDSTIINYRGVKTTVGELRRMFQQDGARRLQLKYGAARDQIFSIEDLQEELAVSIELNKVTPKLANFQQHALEVLQQSGATSQLLELFDVVVDPGTGESMPKYDLNHPLTLNKYIQLFLAYFRSDVMSEQVPGHALTLVSDFGVKMIKRVTRINEQKKPMAWECIPAHIYEKDPERFHYFKQLETDTFEIGDIFIDELRYNVPEYDDQGNIIGYYAEFMMPAHFRELLELGDAPIPEALLRSFGVRIPSQDKHSFISLKLVDFLPTELGSAGIFPKELIEISGADFDVDKLYIQIADFFINKLHDSTNGQQQHVFIRYGDNATTVEQQYKQYLRWNKEKNPYLKKTIERLAFRDTELRDLEKQRTQFRNDKREMNLIFTRGKSLSSASLQKRNELNQRISKLEKQIGEIYERLEMAAMRELGLPMTVAAFQEKNVREGELNIGVLNNRLLDSKIQLLTNDYQQEKGIPFEVANLEPLETVEKDPRVQPGVMEEKNNDIDNPLGKVKAFSNNKEGQANIAPAVNSMLTFTFLNKYGITFRESTATINNSTAGIPFYRVKLNGHTFDGYAHTRSAVFDKKGKISGYTGPRILNVISAIITAMTDNAKERKAAKLNLNIDAVGVASNLIAQGFPKEETIALLLSPAVKTYYRRLRSQQYAIQRGNHRSASYLIRELLEEYQQKAGGEAIQPQELTSQLLFDNLRPGKEDMLVSFSVLYHFTQIIEQTSYFSDIAQILKLSKGLGTELAEWDDNIKRRAQRLGLFDSPEDFKKRPVPFDIREAIWNKHTTTATYLKIALQLEQLSKSIFITRSNLFNAAKTAVYGQLDVPDYMKKKYDYGLTGNLMMFFGITAYLKQLRERGDDLFYFLDNRLIHDTAGIHNTANTPDVDNSYKDIIALVREGKKLQPDNYLLNFLHANPTTLIQKGRIIDNPNNYKGIQLIESNTWAKLDAYQLDKLQNAFIDLYSNDHSRATALGLFAYCIVKDGTLFRSDSLLPFIPSFMLDELLGDVMVNVRNIFKRDDLQQYIDNNPAYAQKFHQVFGNDFKGMMEHFYQIFLPHVTNSFYIPKIVLAGIPVQGTAAPVKFGGSATAPDRETVLINLFDQVTQKMLIQVASAEGITWEEAARSNKKLNTKELQRFYMNTETLRKKGFTLKKQDNRWMIKLPYLIKIRNVDQGHTYYRLESTSEVKSDRDEHVVPLGNMLRTDDWQIWAPKAVYRKTNLQGVSAQTPLAGLFGTVPVHRKKRFRMVGYHSQDLTAVRNHPVDSAADPDEMAVLAGVMRVEDYQAIKTGQQKMSTTNPPSAAASDTQDDFAGYTADFFGEPDTEQPSIAETTTTTTSTASGSDLSTIKTQLAAKGYTFQTVKGKFAYRHNGQVIVFEDSPQELLMQLEKGTFPQAVTTASKSSTKKNLLGNINMSKLREGESYIPDPDDKKNPLNCKGT